VKKGAMSPISFALRRPLEKFRWIAKQ
jgi:hypothetical protein